MASEDRTKNNNQKKKKTATILFQAAFSPSPLLPQFYSDGRFADTTRAYPTAQELVRFETGGSKR